VSATGHAQMATVCFDIVLKGFFLTVKKLSLLRNQTHTWMFQPVSNSLCVIGGSLNRWLKGRETGLSVIITCTRPSGAASGVDNTFRYIRVYAAEVFVKQIKHQYAHPRLSGHDDGYRRPLVASEQLLRWCQYEIGPRLKEMRSFKYRHNGIPRFCVFFAT